jgi:hypothetical protein
MSRRTDPVIEELDTAWMARAACTSMPGLPWTTGLHGVPRVLVTIMRETCAACPVLAECAQYVEDARVTAGWWAGANRHHLTIRDYGPAGRARRGVDEADAPGAA